MIFTYADGSKDAFELGIKFDVPNVIKTINIPNPQAKLIYADDDATIILQIFENDLDNDDRRIEIIYDEEFEHDENETDDVYEKKHEMFLKGYKLFFTALSMQLAKAKPIILPYKIYTKKTEIRGEHTDFWPAGSYNPTSGLQYIAVYPDGTEKCFYQKPLDGN